jgi:hypothetical protein
MRTATRTGLCAVVGTLALLLPGCTTHHHHGHPNPKPLPPGQVKKYETYGHQKPGHVPPGQAKKRPVVVQRQEVQRQQQVTTVQVTMYESPDARPPVAATAPPAPLVQTVGAETYSAETDGHKQHVPPGQVRKLENYGHQKAPHVSPGQGKHDESAPRHEQVRSEHKQAEKPQAPKQELKQEQQQEAKQARKQEPQQQQQQTARGQSTKDDSKHDHSEDDAPRGNGKKNGKK